MCVWRWKHILIRLGGKRRMRRKASLGSVFSARLGVRTGRDFGRQVGSVLAHQNTNRGTGGPRRSLGEESGRASNGELGTGMQSPLPVQLMVAGGCQGASCAVRISHEGNGRERHPCIVIIDGTGPESTPEKGGGPRT